MTSEDNAPQMREIDHAIDLEKQPSSTTESGSGDEQKERLRTDSMTASKHDSDANGKLEDQEEELRESHDRVGGMGRPSTTFAPMPAPNYRTTDGGKAPTAQRSFSRREATLSHQDSHIFGGDVQRAETEAGLSRFQSQQGKDVITVHWEGENDPENPQVSVA